MPIATGKGPDSCPFRLISRISRLPDIGYNNANMARENCQFCQSASPFVLRLFGEEGGGDMGLEKGSVGGGKMWKRDMGMSACGGEWIIRGLGDKTT